MKNVLITLTLIFAGFSFAAEPPLITKNSGGGHMMPEYAGTETCEVFSDRVQITHRLGFYTPTALTVSESRSVRVTGNVVAVIAEAAKETLEEKPNTLCDGPSTTIMAGDVVLFSTGGCGSPRQERTGVFSRKLVQIVDLYCPNTYSFSER